MAIQSESENRDRAARSVPRYFGLSDEPGDIFMVDHDNCREEGGYRWIAVKRFAFSTWKQHKLIYQPNFIKSVRELDPREYCGLELSFEAGKETGTITVDDVRLVDESHVLIEGVVIRGWRERAPFEDEGTSLSGERIILHRVDRSHLRFGVAVFVD